MHETYHLGLKALIKNDQDQYLILKANVKAPENPYWDLPGGRVNKGESVESALRREVMEETGLELISKKPLGTFVTNIRIPAGSEEVGLILSHYECSTTGIEVKLSNEHKDFGWFTPQETAKLLEPKYPREFIEQLKGYP